jgi:hypothetical protein
VAPNPNDNDLNGVDPTTNFVVTRILPNGSERVLASATVTDATQEQVIRQTAFLAARQNRTNNPSWRIVIYGPVDPPSTFWTNDDRVWDSATNL